MICMRMSSRSPRPSATSRSPTARTYTCGSRPDLRNASSSGSDRYEELLVNPTLLTLATQRGDIDCGGLRYLIIGYGHFHQLVVPAAGGHVSIAFELGASPVDYLQAILAVMAQHGQPAA